MTKNKSILLIMSTILAFVIALAVATVARAEEPLTDSATEATTRGSEARHP